MHDGRIMTQHLMYLSSSRNLRRIKPTDYAINHSVQHVIVKVHSNIQYHRMYAIKSLKTLHVSLTVIHFFKSSTTG